MVSLIFNEGLYRALTGGIDFDTNSFKVMLVDGYVPDKDTHLDRADVTGEAAGTGYTAGGAAATVGVTKDTVNDRIDITLGGAEWPTSTITADGAVYYLSTGTAGTDILVAYIDFGGDVVSSAGTFTLTDSTLRVSS